MELINAGGELSEVVLENVGLREVTEVILGSVV